MCNSSPAGKQRNRRKGSRRRHQTWPPPGSSSSPSSSSPSASRSTADPRKEGAWLRALAQFPPPSTTLFVPDIAVALATVSKDVRGTEVQLAVVPAADPSTDRILPADGNCVTVTIHGC